MHINEICFQMFSVQFADSAVVLTLLAPCLLCGYVFMLMKSHPLPEILLVRNMIKFTFENKLLRYIHLPTPLLGPGYGQALIIKIAQLFAPKQSRSPIVVLWMLPQYLMFV